MDPPFSVVGPLAERHPAFPEKVNAEFVQVNSILNINDGRQRFLILFYFVAAATLRFSLVSI